MNGTMMNTEKGTILKMSAAVLRNFKKLVNQTGPSSHREKPVQQVHLNMYQ